MSDRVSPTALSSDTPPPSEHQSSRLQDGIHSVIGLFWSKDSGPKDPSKTDYRAEVERYAGEIIKTAPLFMPSVGRAWTVVSYGASALFQGLDQVHSGDSASRQAVDFGLGLTKGALTKGSFDVLGGMNFGRVNRLAELGLVPRALGGMPLETTAKAFSFGISNRLLDTSLTSQTWLDKSGNVDVSQGMGTIAGSTFSSGALLTDLVVFGGSPLLLKGADVALRGALERSPVLQTIATGASFGMLSGSLSEVQRQNTEDTHFDLSKIAMRGLLEAGATGLGATTGGLRAGYLAGESSRVSAGDNRNLPQDIPAQSRVPVVPASLDVAITRPKPLRAVQGSSWSPELSLARERAIDEPAIESAPTATGTTFDQPLGIRSAEHVGTHNNRAEGALFGAKQYRTADGQEFWQLADGRIYHQTAPAEDSQYGTHEIWAPQGSGQPQGKLEPFKSWSMDANGQVSLTDKVAHLSVDERHGMYRDIMGDADYDYPKTNAFDDPLSSPKHLPMDEPTIERLSMMAPPVELPWQSAVRILPTESGEPYHREEIASWRKGPGPNRLNGKPGPDVAEEFGVPGRRYQILTQEQSVAFAELNEDFSAKKITLKEYQDKSNKLGQEAIQILIPEEYGLRLDALRDLRSLATLSPQMMPEQAERILQAKRDLFTSPYRDRLLPEQFGQFLEDVPDRLLIGNTYLLDGNASQFQAGIAVADTLKQQSQVRIFSGANSAVDPVREILTHEWTHLAESSNEDLLDAYEAARTLEPFTGHKYGLKNKSEHWAVNLGEMFLAPNAELFLTLAHHAPIKSVILADAMQRTMGRASDAHSSAMKEVLQDRLDYIKNNITPLAKAELTRAMVSRNTATLAKGIEFVLALNKGDSGQSLLDRILDKEKLENSIDNSRSNKARSGQFDWQSETRRLMRLEALKQLDRPAFSSRKSLYDSTRASVLPVTRSLLSSPESAKYPQVISMIEAFDHTAELQKLHGALFPISALMSTINNPQHPQAAMEAFQVLTSGAYDKWKTATAVSSIAQSNGPIRLAAAQFLMGDSQYILMPESVESLSKLIEQGVPEINSPEMVESLSESIDQTLDKVEFDPLTINQTFWRAALLERILEANPTMVDAPMRERFQHVDNLKAIVRDWLADGIEHDRIGYERDSSLHMLSGLDFASDPVSIALLEELAPKTVLERAIADGTITDRKTIDMVSRLHGS